MGADQAALWGPPRLVDVVADQLERHGLGDAEPADFARQLTDAKGAATRASLFVDLGARNFLDGDVAGAIANWRQAVSLGQAAPATRAMFNLALLNEDLGLHDYAVELFSRIETDGTQPHASLAVLAKARNQDLAGRPADAVETLAALIDSTIVHRPNDPLLGESLLGIGEISLRTGDRARAEHAYRAAMNSSDPAAASAGGARLVEVLRRQGRADEAQEVINRFGLVDGNPALGFERIEQLLRLGLGAEALDLIERTDPSGFDTADSFRWNEILVEAGQTDRAIDRLEVLVQSDVAEIWSRAAVSLGQIYLGHAMPAEAEAMFESVAATDVAYWSDRAALELGDLLHQRGDNKGAAQAWAGAAASPVESLASGARDRLVRAVDASSRHLDAGVDVEVEGLGAEATDTDTDRGADQDSTATATDESSNPNLDGGSEAPSDPGAEAEEPDDEDLAIRDEPLVIVLARNGSHPHPTHEPETAGVGSALGAEPAARDSSSTDATYDSAGLGVESDPVAEAVAVRSDEMVIDLRAHRPGAGADNPYAELAPPAIDGDVNPSTHNPYAELAPDFGLDDP